MGLTAKQKLEEKPEEKAEWSIRRLFPVSVVTSLSKVFTNPFDILLAIIVIFLGAAELMGHSVSWGMWVFAVTLLVLDFVERNKENVDEVKKTKKK